MHFGVQREKNHTISVDISQLLKFLMKILYLEFLWKNICERWLQIGTNMMGRFLNKCYANHEFAISLQL